MSSSTLAERVKEARLQTALKLRETVSQARMAEMVAAILRTPLAQAQWSLYERGESEPPLAVIRATAQVSGLDESYLAFGTQAEPADAATIDGELVAVPAPHPSRGLGASRPTKRRKGRQ